MGEVGSSAKKVMQHLVTTLQASFTCTQDLWVILSTPLCSQVVFISWFKSAVVTSNHITGVINKPPADGLCTAAGISRRQLHDSTWRSFKQDS